MNRAEAAKSIRRKIEGAYNDRDDYPPYALTPFADRPLYHQYIIKLLEEWGGLRE